MNFNALLICRAITARAFIGFFTLGLVVACANAVRPATFVVANTGDSGVGSFRNAVSLANQSSDEDDIVFDPTAFAGTNTVVLTSGEIIITAPLRIIGPGTDRLAISGNDLSRVLFLRNTAVVHLSNLTIRNGKAPSFTTTGFSNYAGGLYVEGGALYLSQVTVKDCTAEQGGGIFNQLGTLHVIKSTISNNQATGGRNDGSYGGGINNQGTLVISNSRIVGNIARGGNAPVGGGGSGSGIAGGLFIFSGPVSISQSLIEGNAALGGSSAGGFGGAGSGAGIYTSGSIVIADSLINNNNAVAGSGDIPSRAGNSSGGGIVNLSDAQIINVTVSNNSIASTSGFVSGGAGIWNGCTSCLTLTNSTVAFNNANALGGGGVYGYSAFRLRNTVVAKNLAAFAPDVLNTATSLGSNLVGNGDGSFGLAHGVNGDRVGTTASPIDPLLGALSDNGGLTQTYIPQIGSLAINNGDNCVLLPSGSGGCLSAPLLNDQRGFARLHPAGGAVDIGAAEVGSTPIIPLPPDTPDLAPESDLGVSDADNLTSSRAPRFMVSGVPAGSVVELLRDGSVVGTVYSASVGSVVVTDSPTADGTFEYSSRVVMNGSVGTSSGSLSVQFDTVRPVVSVEQGPSQTDPTAIGSAAFVVSANEPINGLTVNDVSLAGSTANTTLAIIGLTGSGPSFGVTVQNVISDGQIDRVSVPEGSVNDNAGNTNANSVSNDNTVTIDNVAPSVTVNKALGQADPTSTQPISFSVLFSETISGFSPEDISFSGSTANTSSASVIISGAGAFYNVSVSNLTSSGTVTMRIPQGVVADALGNVNTQSTSTDNTVIFDLKSGPFDFDGDGKTDIGIFRPAASGGEWWINRSGNGQTFALQFGASTDRITPADYTGDGKADIAFFRPSSGEWYVLRSEDFSFFALPFGTNGDVPVPADYDADGKADFAVFRPSSSTWYLSQSSGAPTRIVQFGVTGDQPVAADYDADGKADIGIFRPAASGGEWWIERSTAGSFAMQFGAPTDKTVQGDYTGDGKADVAVWRPSTGEWFIVRSEDSSFYGFPFGASSDTPAPADYDGDGKFDPTVFRPSSATWFIARTTAGTQIVQFGATGDRPIPNAFIP